MSSPSTIASETTTASALTLPAGTPTATSGADLHHTAPNKIEHMAKCANCHRPTRLHCACGACWPDQGCSLACEATEQELDALLDAVAEYEGWD